MEDKQNIRKQIEAKRRALDSQWTETASARVAENLQTLEAFQTAKTIALYMAMGGEVHLETLLPTCWELNKHTCIPVFNTETRFYEMALITAGTPCRTGHYGIREPISPTLVPMEEIDLMAVPGMAFDLHGNRLGRGGGYYDRLLEGFRGHALGIAFDFQILPRIPVAAHDQSVDGIVTETQILNI